MLIPSLELLERLLSGEQISSTGLNQLIAREVSEDLYIEYKHGDVLKNCDVNDTIREYLSGFANSAGGILIIGINAPDNIPLEVTGCHNHSKGKLDEWAVRCLTPLANYFSPFPRFQVVAHDKGDVLVCFTQRSFGLVPISKSGGINYHFRLHDQTLKAPDYLMTDLLLGRRQSPIFDISEFKVLNFGRSHDQDIMDFSFEVRIRVENSSIVWADECKWGIICWTQTTKHSLGISCGKPSQHLSNYIDVKDGSFPDPRQMQLVHYYGSMSVSTPFDTGTIFVGFVVPLRCMQDWYSFTWKSALYFLAKNSLPIWYQLEFDIFPDRIKLVDEKTTLVPSAENRLRVSKLWMDRPVVAWQMS